jgi:uncharacterized protein YndB with AHSA1/START domain
LSIIQVKSLQEAIEWVKRAPNVFPNGEAEVSIRKVMDVEDFGDGFTPNPEIAKVKIQWILARGTRRRESAPKRHREAIRLERTQSCLGPPGSRLDASLIHWCHFDPETQVTLGLTCITKLDRASRSRSPSPGDQPMEFSITTDVDASADLVFAVLTDVERWPEWTPTVTRVERLDGSSLPLAISSRMRVVQPKVPPAEWTVTALEAGRGSPVADAHATTSNPRRRGSASSLSAETSPDPTRARASVPFAAATAGTTDSKAECSVISSRVPRLVAPGVFVSPEGFVRASARLLYREPMR